MFEYLGRYKRVIVTGPHRSGTTIAAEMIANDTGLVCHREEAFGNHNITEARQIRDGVIQGPYLLPWLPLFDDGRTACVYMSRNAKDIMDSVSRLGVSKPFFTVFEAAPMWDYLEPQLKHSYVVEYAGLAAHPMYVHKRNGWHHRQTNAKATP